MNYDNMTDFEINLAVAEIEHGRYCNIIKEPFLDASIVQCSSNSFGTIFTLDYCNKVSDSWTIIVDNKISVIYEGESGRVELNLGDGYSQTVPYIYKDANPLRAAMIVFLMMQEKAE